VRYRPDLHELVLHGHVHESEQVKVEFVAQREKLRSERDFLAY
jgi:hypothetical protein